MKPLSTFTYYRRHKGHAALLLCLSLLITAGLYSMIALVWAIFVEQPRLSYMALSEFSIVSPGDVSSEQGSEVAARLRANPDIADILPAKTIKVTLPGLLQSEGYQFEFHGLMEKDANDVLKRVDASLKQGHMPAPGTNQLVISEDIAAMLGLQVGDYYEIVSSEFYSNIDSPLEPTSFEVAGILESDLELGMVSLEYLDNHPFYRHFPDRFLVLAEEDHEALVDDFLVNEIQSLHTTVLTLSMLNERIINEALPGLVMLLPIVIIVAAAFSLVIVVVNRIANAGRLSEFGILHAVGYGKRYLSRRLTVETTLLAIAGWFGGIGLAWLLLYLLGIATFSPKGYDLDYPFWIPAAFTLLVPAIIAGVTVISTRRTFGRLDPVSVVERGLLSQEDPGKEFGTRKESSQRPLAALTFYSRHRRRAAWLVGSTCLMILAVMLFIFTLAVSADAQMPLFGYLGRLSMISSSAPGLSLDQNIITGLGDHAAVERLIPMAPRYHMLDIYIPPFNRAEASPFAVYAEDMAFLVNLYNLQLREGRLPHPGTNEMVIPEVLAQNRHLEVGDTIGDSSSPAYPGAASLPAHFAISGIFESPRTGQNGNGLGFISLEFLENAEPYPLPDGLPLMVVAKEGQLAQLNSWLEKEVDKANISLLTIHGEINRVQQKAQQDMFTMGILEGIIALVAALGLGVLNYIYISQRQAEFGVLHALGYGLRQLIRRAFRETAFTMGTAWLISVSLCLLSMLFLRFLLFAPRGLSFSLWNVTPWIYTLPIPILVLVITTFVTARTLSKLDAVTIIETRPT